MKSLLIAALMLAAPRVIYANSISPFVTTAIEFGGDNLVHAAYSDGSTSDIKAGQGLILAGGAIFDLSGTTPHTFEAQTSFGIKWQSTKQATNGEADWYRWPLEVLSFYHNTELFYRLGGGLTYQFGNQIKGSGAASSVSTDFKSALGVVLEGDYFFGQTHNLGLGVRYTIISYTPSGTSASVNGDSFGLNLTYVWL